MSTLAITFPYDPQAYAMDKDGYDSDPLVTVKLVLPGYIVEFHEFDEATRSVTTSEGSAHMDDLLEGDFISYTVTRKARS